jgi:hypothetical protein
LSARQVAGSGVIAMRHDVAVLMAIAMRLEAAQAATLQELHATRAQARCFQHQRGPHLKKAA